jgi:hypothetical protein
VTFITYSDKNWRPAVCRDENETLRSIARIPGNIGAAEIITGFNALWRGCDDGRSSSTLLCDASCDTWRYQTDNKPNPHRGK